MTLPSAQLRWSLGLELGGLSSYTQLIFEDFLEMLFQMLKCNGQMLWENLVQVQMAFQMAFEMLEMACKCHL